VPFEGKGALETFLLNSLANQDTTDGKVINQCNKFIDNLDSDGKYLTSRRHLTKAKFDTYFSVRTPVEQFSERRNILKGVHWENYEIIQDTFKELRKLS
jgi:hypothetical protein